MEYRAEALAWLAEDPDPDTRDELQHLLDIGDGPGLADRFAERLEFGTAGMRGAMGAGPNRMNRATVRRVTAGLADRLNAAAGAGARGVVVGRDARHNSDAFEVDTVRVLAGSGLGVWTFDRVVPTPVVAYGVRYLEAAAGVMITASHNPPADNGYKVYGPSGRQIIPPLDSEISQAIDAVGPLDGVPLARPDSTLIWRVDPEMIDHYIADVLAMVDQGPRDLRIVYTPLHGVAADICQSVLAKAGFADVHVVAEQAIPDPDFPTVEFPNPEEPGAMDLAMALAVEIHADLILANDPDGDRIAIGVPAADGGWRMLNGDEIGTVLAESLLASGRLNEGRQPAVATTVVSSSLLSEIAAHHGATYLETLTGFKWLSKAAEDLGSDSIMVLAYEQALGVSVGDLVRDKDGIGAVLVAADLAARERAAGRSLAGMLDDLAARHGAHVTLGRSVLLEGDADAEGGEGLVQAALDRLRHDPPTELGGSPVVQTWDHDAGVTTGADGSIDQIDLPATPLLRYVAADGTRVMVRPSGTEPKLKFYGEAIGAVDPAAPDPATARTSATGHIDTVLTAFMDRALGGPAT